MGSDPWEKAAIIPDSSVPMCTHDCLTAGNKASCAKGPGDHIVFCFRSGLGFVAEAVGLI